MNEMFGRIELITPERAQQLLDSVIINRSFKQNNLRKIENAIISGNFTPTHQGIAIDPNGHMFDGNHRCKAVVDTGIPTKMFVIYNAKNVAEIDSGVSRSERDQLYMSGMIDKDSALYKNIGMALLNTILRRNFTQDEFRGMSSTTKYKFYMKKQGLIDRTICCLYSNNYSSSCITYAMACALQSGVSENTLRDWHKILVTGDFYNEDEKSMLAGRAILKFRDVADSVRKANVGTNMEQAVILIKKAMSSIDYFDRKISVTKIYGSFVYPEIKI